MVGEERSSQERRRRRGERVGKGLMDISGHQVRRRSEERIRNDLRHLDHNIPAGEQMRRMSLCPLTDLFSFSALSPPVTRLLHNLSACLRLVLDPIARSSHFHPVNTMPLVAPSTKSRMRPCCWLANSESSCSF
eukprot:748923-Hanusia_phi.AAC.2